MASGPFLGSGAWVTSVSANDSTQREELGILRFEAGKVFKYVQASAATIPAANAVEYVTNATTVRQAAANAATFAGVAETALTTSFYGWITVQGGVNAAVGTGAGTNTALIVAGTAGMFTAATSASAGQRNAVALTTGLGSTAGSTATAIVLSCL